MGIGLVLLAGHAVLDVFTDVGRKARPPEFSCDKLAGFQVPRVAGGVVVMAMLENGMVK